MANLKEVRTRITSVNSTKQITNAMRMVSASKLRKAQTAILSLRPYSNKLRELIEKISGDSSVKTAFHENRPVQRVALVIVASNKGLCGAFNANILKRANKRIEELLAENPSIEIHLITIGKRVVDHFRNTKYKRIPVSQALSENPHFDDVSLFVEDLMNQFKNEKLDRIECVYNQFKNAATQIIQVETFLPIESNEKETTASIDYIFEPDKTGLIQNLIPQVLKTQMYKVVLDSLASEHGARMTTMHKATDNANELLKSLKLSYNKARQSSITNEIIEIIGGAEALNN